jgi:hypothetical protein
VFSAGVAINLKFEGRTSRESFISPNGFVWTTMNCLFYSTISTIYTRLTRRRHNSPSSPHFICVINNNTTRTVRMYCSYKRKTPHPPRMQVSYGRERVNEPLVARINSPPKFNYTDIIIPSRITVDHHTFSSKLTLRASALARYE